MGGIETAVADTSALVSLGIPSADSRYDIEKNPDPLQNLLTSCSVYLPETVVYELSDVAQYSDIHAVAAANVLRARDFYTVKDPLQLDRTPDQRPSIGLDDGETDGILLANRLSVDGFLTDEFGSTDFAVIHAALERSRLVPSPRLIRDYALNGHMSPRDAIDLIHLIGTYRSWEGNPYVERIVASLESSKIE